MDIVTLHSFILLKDLDHNALGHPDRWGVVSGATMFRDFGCFGLKYHTG